MSVLVSMLYDFSHGNQHICLTKHSFEIIINVEQLCLKCGFVKKKGYASKQHEFKPNNSNYDNLKSFLVLSDTYVRRKCLVSSLI